MVRTIKKTLNGERTRVEEINVEFPFKRTNQNSWLISKLIVSYKNLSLVMAGMYIGLNCYGTPHSHHKKTEGECGPDNRLI